MRCPVVALALIACFAAACGKPASPTPANPPAQPLLLTYFTMPG